MSTNLEFLVGHELAVYSSSGCPDCARLDRWMRAHDVPHVKMKIDEEPALAERLERETGKQAVPFILVDGKRWVRGYHKEERSRFNEEKLLNELREAVG